MDFPKHIVKLGEPDQALVAAVIAKLAERGYLAKPSTVVFDADLRSLVKLFQSQNADINGMPLKVDGQIGPLTWTALFDATHVTATNSDSAGLAALAKAASQVGVMEVPPGSNRGQTVEAYLAATNLGGGFFWCMAFVYWCFREGTKDEGIANPFPKTAGCLDAWNKVKLSHPTKLITKGAAQGDPSLVKPGAVFILDLGRGLGHTGIIKSNRGGSLITIEGNSNPAGSSNGVGVFEISRRSVMSSNLKGFINFT